LPAACAADTACILPQHPGCRGNCEGAGAFPRPDSPWSRLVRLNGIGASWRCAGFLRLAAASARSSDGNACVCAARVKRGSEGEPLCSKGALSGGATFQSRGFVASCSSYVSLLVRRWGRLSEPVWASREFRRQSECGSESRPHLQQGGTPSSFRASPHSGGGRNEVRD
jgi:hypothetical protein